jgi:hypothetical protein
MGRAAMKWLVTIGATIFLATAMLLWGLVPASECSTPQEIHWFTGFPVFVFFLAAGCYIATRGTLAQRLLLFIASAAIVAGYVATLSQSLPMVLQLEISCAAQGLR